MYWIKLAIVLPLFSQVQAPKDLPCALLPAVMDALVSSHYARDELAQEANARAVSRFIEYLDPMRSLLLNHEAKRIEQQLHVEFPRIRHGDCSPLSAAARIILSRVKENERIAKQLLDDDFKLDESVKLTLDPEKRGYAIDAQARKALIQTFVHFYVYNELYARTPLAKAKKNVLHRFELVRKRTQEIMAESELPGLFAQAYAAGLDSHSTFLSAEILEEFRINMNLSLEGIGAVLRSEYGYTVIQSIVPGGQADKSKKLLPLDKIIAVAQDGAQAISVIDMALRDVVRMIRGPKGTKVTLTVLRESEKTHTFELTIVRDKIDIKERAAKMDYETRKVNGCKINIGVLRLPSFYGGSGDGRSSFADVKRLLVEAKEKKVHGLVLDLSENGGGLLSDAVDISGLFLKTGAVVATRSSSGQTDVFTDNDEDIAYRGPLVVMTSHLSASGSEILVAALQDYKRAVIVGGTRTFGKGTVQMVSPLPNELGALKITTGMFFRPSGTSIQKLGIRSDLLVTSIFNHPEIGEMNIDHALENQSIPSFLSDSVNSNLPEFHWSPVTLKQISLLRNKSKARIQKNPQFVQIRKDLQEQREDDDVVHLKELKQRATRDKERNVQKEFEAKKDAFIKECVNIAMDMVMAGRKLVFHEETKNSKFNKQG